MRAAGEDRDGMRITFLALGLGMGKEKPAVFGCVQVTDFEEEFLQRTATEIGVVGNGYARCGSGGMDNELEFIIFFLSLVIANQI